MKTLIEQLNNTAIYYDEFWDNIVGKPYCRKMEDISTKDRKFFSQYWQGFAWSAIIGFIKDRHSELETSTKKSSFKYQVISNQSSRMAKALILLAISKSDQGYEILREPNKIAQIISEYAKGGAEYIKEIKDTPGQESFFDSEDDFVREAFERLAVEEVA